MESSRTRRAAGAGLRCYRERAGIKRRDGWGVRGRSADALRNRWRVEEREGKLLTSGQQRNDETKRMAWSKVK